MLVPKELPLKLNTLVVGVGDDTTAEVFPPTDPLLAGAGEVGSGTTVGGTFTTVPTGVGSPDALAEQTSTVTVVALPPDPGARVGVLRL